MSEPRLKLAYLGSPYTYVVDQIIAYALVEDWYVPVYEAPVREMLSRTPTAMAEELLRMVSSSDWAAHFTRSMRLGDKFTMNGTDWVFIPERDVPALRIRGFETVVLPSWPKTAIVNTNTNESNNKKCNNSQDKTS